MADQFGSTNYQAAPGAPAPMVDANNIESSQLDPTLSQALLSKLASGAPLLPAEKLAASKLPPSVLSRAAQTGSAPLPDSYKAPLPAAERGPAPQVRPLAGNPLPTATTPTQVPGAPPPATPSTFPPAGNSAENQGLLPSGHYAGMAQYSGSTIVDPVNPPGPADSPSSSAAPGPAGTSGPAGAHEPMSGYNSPTVQAAQQVAASPGAPPSLKGMKGQDIAKMIGDILDVVGVGLSARGGVNRQTRLEQQIGLQQQAAAKTAEAQGQANVDIDKEVRLAPVEIQKAIALARASGDIGTENAIRLKNALAPIDLSDAKQLAAYTANLDVESKKRLFAMGIPVPGMTLPMSLFTNPGQAGINHGATIAGVGIQ